MARKKVVRRRRSFARRAVSRAKKITIPLAVVAGFASPIIRTYQHGRDFGIAGEEGAIAEFSRIMIGINPLKTPVAFESFRLRYGLLPVMLGLGVHKLAGYLGINRMLSQAGIPVVRI